MHELYRLKENLIKELEDIGSKDVSKSNLEVIDKLAHATKNVAKVIEACEEDEYSNAMGYSRRGSYAEGGSYRGGSYANDMSGDYVRPDGSYRDGGSSYARGRGRGAKRDSMGRYSRAEDEVMQGLMKLADKAPDEQTRSEIMKLMDRM